MQEGSFFLQVKLSIIVTTIFNSFQKLNYIFFSESFTGCDGSGDSTETYACCNSTNKPQGCGLLEGDCDRCRSCPFIQISSQFYHDFVKILLDKDSFLIYWKTWIKLFFLIWTKFGLRSCSKKS